MRRITLTLGLVGTLSIGFARQSPEVAPPALYDNIDGGSGTFVHFIPDDTLPLPDPAVVDASSAGDRVVRARTGDPFFLAFAGGRYYPPDFERIDPLLESRLQSLYADGRPSQETYAFAMLSRRLTGERAAELEALGVRVLGTHPFQSLKLALAPAAIARVAALPYVRWIGMARDAQKLHPALVARLAQAQPGQLIDVVVDVFESDLNPASIAEPIASVEFGTPGGALEAGPVDGPVPTRMVSNGWQQRALEQLGLLVGEYAESTLSFRARLTPGLLQSVIESDFVQFVELDLPAMTAHDESMPMIQADFTRVAFGGGASSSALAGICDSGLDYGHDALNNGYVVGWDYTAAGNPFQDGCLHGSHVAGSIFGSGDVRASWKGVAPGLGWGQSGRIYVARIFDNACASAGTSTGTIMTAFAQPYTDGSGNVTQRPHVINHSWGACNPVCGSGGPYATFFGTEQAPRDIDNAIYSNGQLHIFCAGNEGPQASSIRMQGTSKNALTVGAVVDFHDAASGDPGSLADFSSRGPCADGRWKPNVVAPGNAIWSAMAGTTTGYMNNAGTSMATPHVTGLGAQLCDHYPYLQYQPARLSSILMATAMTSGDALLTFPSDQHLREYGTGRVEATKAHHATNQFYWISTGFDQGYLGWTVSDFTVPAGATRIVVCMTYHESAASAGAAYALVNDYDLWIDSPTNGIDPNGNTGEYFSQQSVLNNTEIRIIDAPQPGNWRCKVYPTNVGFFANAHFGLTVCIISGDTTPDGALLLEASRNCIAPGEVVDITATVSNPSYVASALFLDSSSNGDALIGSATTLKDGAVTNLLGASNQTAGRDVLLGDITFNETRAATWSASWPTEGIKDWHVEARSDNWAVESQAIQITVDGTPPGVAGNLASNTHPINVWSNVPNIGFVWTTAPDNLCGIDGYGLLSANAPALPTPVKVIEEVTAHAQALATGTWFFNLRAVDNCANWSTTYAASGPYLIDTIAPIGPSGLGSPSHQVGVQSCSSVATVQWTAASDADSGGAGYLGVWDGSPTTIPAGPPNIGALATSFTIDIGSSPAARYFHLRALDLAGNYGVTQHFGPLYADANSIREYCTAKVNSLGCTPAIAWTGQPSLSNPSLNVTCSSVINKKIGLLFWGRDEFAAPFQGGILCVKPPVTRTVPQNSNGSATGQDCSGHYAYGFTGAYMSTQGMLPGQTIYCQWWARDPNSPSTTSLSDAVMFTVCE